MRAAKTAGILAGAILLTVALPAVASAQLKVAKNHLDLGRIFEGEIKTLTFTIANESDTPVTLGNARASCGCTVASIDHSQLVAGQQAEVDVRFDSRGWSGRIDKNVAISTSDENQPSIVLYFSAEVVQRYEITPSVVYLPKINSATGATAELVFTDNSGGEVRLKEVTIDDTRLQLAVERKQTQGQPETAKVKLTVPPGLPEGRLETYITFHTTDSKKPQDRIYVVGRVYEKVRN